MTAHEFDLAYAQAMRESDEISSEDLEAAEDFWERLIDGTLYTDVRG